MIHEFDFISGKFFDLNIPKENRYLLRYFKTKLQRAYLNYKLLNGEKRYFTRHTGYLCNPYFWKEQNAKFNHLVRAYSKAKKNIDLEMLEKIERGKFRK